MAKLADVPVAFHGVVMERGEIYEQIDLLVVTSRAEGLSLAIMEAMARSIPVIATDVGGNPSLVLPEETGLLVPFGNLAALGTALSSIIREPEILNRLGRAARQHIHRNHSLQRTAKAYLDVYGTEAQQAPLIPVTG